jgi:hypothetical protein
VATIAGWIEDRFGHLLRALRRKSGSAFVIIPAAEILPVRLSNWDKSMFPESSATTSEGDSI